MNPQYFLCIFFFSLIHVRDCRCYIWTYALSQSLSEGAYEDQVYHPRNIHQNADEPLQAGVGDENHTKRDWTVRLRELISNLFLDFTSLQSAPMNSASEDS